MTFILLYEHLFNTGTPILWTIPFVRRETYVSSIKLTCLSQTLANTDNEHFSVSPVTNTDTLSIPLYGQYSKNNRKVILAREYRVSRCEYGFHGLNLLQLTLAIKQWFSAIISPRVVQTF